jgi:hypothetical protein
MSFKIKLKNKHASFSFKTEKEVEIDFVESLCSIAFTAMDYSGEDEEAQTFIGPKQHPDNLVDYTASSISGINVQEKLGEKPVNEINMGDYKSPTSGLMLKILSLPPKDTPRVPIIKAFRDITKIPLMASREILLGNHRGPLFKAEMMMSVLKLLKDNGIFAKGYEASAA